ncbi:MAG: Spy/CpxP family protein refolding chaperone [Rhodopila sp.]|nr:Spy/CpxP family protein refolding chaperone [Rhodopila sp.]
MKKLVMLGIVLLASGPVLAQPVSPPPKAASSAAAVPQVDQRITQMHQRLKITPQQEAAWNAFAQVMQANATSADQAYKQRAASIESMSAVDNLRSFAQIEQTRAQGVQNLSVSFETLYGLLSDDQKKVADDMFRQHAERAQSHKQNTK